MMDYLPTRGTNNTQGAFWRQQTWHDYDGVVILPDNVLLTLFAFILIIQMHVTVMYDPVG